MGLELNFLASTQCRLIWTEDKNVVAAHGCIIFVDAINDNPLVLTSESLTCVMWGIIFDDKIFVLGGIGLEYDSALFVGIDELRRSNGEVASGPRNNR